MDSAQQSKIKNFTSKNGSERVQNKHSEKDKAKGGSGTLIIGLYEKINNIADVVNIILEEKWKTAKPIHDKLIEYEKQNGKPNCGLKMNSFDADKHLRAIITQKEYETLKLSEIRCVFALKLNIPSKSEMESTTFKEKIKQDLSEKVITVRIRLKEIGCLEDTEIGIHDILLESLCLFQMQNEHELTEYGLLAGIQLASYDSKIRGYNTNDLTTFGGKAKIKENKEKETAIRETREEAFIDVKNYLDEESILTVQLERGSKCFVVDIDRNWSFSKSHEHITLEKVKPQENQYELFLNNFKRPPEEQKKEYGEQNPSREKKLFDSNEKSGNESPKAK